MAIMGESDQNTAFDGYPDSEAWRELMGQPGQPSRASTMYRMRLNNSAPEILLSSPKNGRPANSARGAQILKGVWKFGDSHLEAPDGCAPWGPPFPSLHFADRIHRFFWLRDLIATGSSGEALGRSLIVSWTDHFGRWDAFAWRADVVADRVINWLSAAPSVITTLEQSARETIFDSLSRQVRHLLLMQEEPMTLYGAFRRAVALVLAGASLPDGDKYRETGLAALEQELEQQLLADGGHISRRPSRLAEMLIDLHIAEDILLRMGQSAPGFLTRAQSRMQNMLKFLATPDGGCLVGHGGSDGTDGLVKTALSPYGDGGGRFAFAQLTGYHRIQADKLTVYIDTAEAPADDSGQLCAASCLALSLFDGPDRLITQIGATDDLDPEWLMAARRTGAHSTLQIGDEDSAPFLPSAQSGLFAPSGPDSVSARRLEEADQFLLEAQHGGWREKYGLIHRRRLYINKDGRRLTGEDSLSRPLSENMSPPNEPIPYAIRFQLHPDVKLAEGPDDRTLFLGLEDRGRVWRLRSEAPIDIIDSVYCAASPRRKASQLVIKGEADPLGDGGSTPNRVRWALSLVHANE